MSTTDFSRYAAQLHLPGFSMEGQQRILDSRVLVIGAGGLGCPALQYLTAAGVGTIAVVDGDTVSLDNLQRQILYEERQVGENKAKAAAQRLRALNQTIKLVPIPYRIVPENAITLLREYDVILDCSDNFPTRYLISDACSILGKPVVYGAVHQWQGQAALFVPANSGQRTLTYRDLFPQHPGNIAVESCAAVGISGALTGVVGSMQANLTLQLLAGNAAAVQGRLWTIDLLTLETSLFEISPNQFPESAPAEETALLTHEYGFDTDCTVQARSIDDCILLDVREEYEPGLQFGSNIIRIPLHRLRDEASALPAGRIVAVSCSSGQRSKIAVRILKEEFGREAFNLHDSNEFNQC